MIIGMDLMFQLGLNIDCKEKTINGDGSEFPMKTRTVMQDAELIHMLYYASTTPEALEQAELHQDKILDADYSKVDIDPFVAELSHLTTIEKQLLAQT